jgi:hypothetical protein
MTRKQKIFLALALTLPELGFIAVAIIRTGRIRVPRLGTPIKLEGSILEQNSDPTKQTPLPGVTVTAASGSAFVTGKSDPAGFFSITLNAGAEKSQEVVLTFRHPNYKTLEMTTTKPGNQLYIARMEPLQPESKTSVNSAGTPVKIAEIKNIRVRYSFKNQSTVSVGSLAKQFSAPNTGNVPCRGQNPCSPDGRWKATKTTLSVDAEEGNEFRNVRISCIAGPCAFTKTEPDHFTRPERRITVSVLNWSDTTDFLVEADEARTMVTDEVRYSYPFTVGPTLNFALPPGSEGPSVEADLDGQFIVFPLGPALILSWGTCSVQVSPDGNKVYRCQLKPGYRFQE